MPTALADASDQSARAIRLQILHDMKRLRKWLILFVALIGCYFVVGLLLFRLPIGRKQRLQGAVWFKYFDLGDGSFRYWAWEAWPWGSKDLYLVDKRLLYVSKSDYQRLWAEDPFVLDKQSRTKKVVVAVYPVLLGGYGKAKVESIEEVQGTPLITK